ncbi:hypothetical protein BDFB_002819 [Asbolus verrucosus]|uniref:Uncharacterized protein n=1 Tax=Asbolus verrucosus TaxID=1661398 RepID=A0A482V6L3_ASBVE|nr:hypothetical protein BDFB_002819 [Asbolus verrucosus]
MAPLDIFNGGAPRGIGDLRNIPGSAGWHTQANIFYRPVPSSRVRDLCACTDKDSTNTCWICFVMCLRFGRSTLLQSLLRLDLMNRRRVDEKITHTGAPASTR